MSTNCLVTKLKSEVQNDNLKTLGAVDIKATAVNTSNPSYIMLKIGWNKHVKVTSKTLFSVYKANSSTGATIEELASNVYEYNYTYSDATNQNGTLKLSVPSDSTGIVYTVHDKYNLTYIGGSAPSAANLNANIDVDMEDLTYISSLSILRNIIGSGNIEALANIKDVLENLNIVSNSSTIYGDAAKAIGSNLQVLQIAGANSNISLDFDSLIGGGALTSIQIYSNTNVKGDVLTWANRLWNNGAGKTSGTVGIVGINSGATCGSYGWGTNRNDITFSENSAPTVNVVN